MLYGVVVRSPFASALVTHVDTEAARAMPGVFAVLGPDDVPDRCFGDIEADERVLARERVRYVGEPVALVAARTAAEARAAAAVVDVRYEPRPGVVTLERALAGDSPRVAPDRPNVEDPSTVSRGDVEAAFGRAAHIVETTVRTQRAHQGYIELRCALAELDADGRLIVTMTSQAPFQVRRAICAVFELPMTRVVVRVPAFGGGFGGKLHNGMALYATALALATRRPVQVVSSRSEELQAGNPREGSIVALRSAVDADGRILGRVARAYFDSGAYAYDTPIITDLGAMLSCGPYDVEAVHAEVHAVRTNTHSTGSFRGPAAPQMCFANEVHMDDIAKEVGLGRLAVRRKNFMRSGSLGPTGQTLDDPAIETCFDSVVTQLDDWRSQRRSDDRVYGYGIACAWWTTAHGPSAAVARVNEDATVTVYSGATEIGTGAVVSGLTALVAAELGLPLDSVSLVTADTDAAPADMGSEGSRTLYGAGNAVLQAASAARAILAAAAAEELEASPDDLVFANETIHVVGSPTASVSLRDAAAAATRSGGPVVGGGRFEAPAVPTLDGCASNMRLAAFNEPTFHCHGVEIEIDQELGTVRPLRYVAAHDTGSCVSIAGVKGQVEGGVVQGLGYALYEEVLIDADGSTRNADLVDYRLPTIADTPEEIVVLPIENFPSAHGPRGAKGIGEPPVILPAAAIASAVRDGLGVRLTELPLRADRVAAAVEARLESSANGGEAG
jgi:CO/xanthine dehydrogenase Mo-binding subunit